MKIKCLTVDDEPFALDLVSKYVERTPFLQLAGKCSSAEEAYQWVQHESIDLLFLDIQMPNLSGVSLARLLEKGPRVIFTTAYQQYALEGYKLDVLDYLLKPFNYEEFLRAAQKARDYFQLREKAEGNEKAPDEEDGLFVKAEYKLVKINFNDILYIESLKDYVKIYTGPDKPLLSLLSLKTLEERLPPHRFMRVHRSFIVALDKITTIAGNHIVFGKVQIPISSQYKDAFFAFINRKTV
jgi:DNA-binding LytR/AlgR family response regulator